MVDERVIPAVYGKFGQRVEGDDFEFEFFDTKAERRESDRTWILVGRILIRGYWLNVQHWFKVFEDFDRMVDFALLVSLKRNRFVEKNWSEFKPYKDSRIVRYRDLETLTYDGMIRIKLRHLKAMSGKELFYDIPEWRIDGGKRWAFRNYGIVKSLVNPIWRYDVLKFNFEDEWEEWGDVWIALRFTKDKFKELMKKWSSEGKVKPYYEDGGV